jgi:hypothetical protein
MTDIIMDDGFDLGIVDGDIYLFEDISLLTVQKVTINLQNYRGEWFRDVNTGVPYLQQILGVRNSKELADTIIKTTIVETDNIDTILTYSSTVNKERQLIVTFSALMVTGGTIENITVEI